MAFCAFGSLSGGLEKRKTKCEIMTERWTEGGFFKSRPSPHTHWAWFEPLLRLSSRVKRAALPNLSTILVSRASVRKNREITEKREQKERMHTERERER